MVDEVYFFSAFTSMCCIYKSFCFKLLKVSQAKEEDGAVVDLGIIGMNHPLPDPVISAPQKVLFMNQDMAPHLHPTIAQEVETDSEFNPRMTKKCFAYC